MIVMPANSSGWFWHCLARETGNIGHLYSPGAQRGPWPWFPYALDNGAFSCWTPESNEFDNDKWAGIEPEWRRMVYWAASAVQRPRWAIVPDVPGDAVRTFEKWEANCRTVADSEILPALAVQDGMHPKDVHALKDKPSVICVGGSTEWKWNTVAMWAEAFPRVHVLRCNSPAKLEYLSAIGVESCDGTGWNRGDRTQTQGLESFVRKNPKPVLHTLTPYVCRRTPKSGQMEWAFT